MAKISVEFSELALAGLANVNLNAEKQKTIEYAIRFFLKAPDAIFKSRRCPAFDDLDLYIWPIERVRVLFESGDNFVRVWAISEAMDSPAETDI